MVGCVPSLPAIPTAVACCQQVIIRNERGSLEVAELLLRHLELVPAGTGLAELGRHVAELCGLLAREDQTSGGPTLLVDVSVLGQEPWIGRFGAHRPLLVTVAGGTGEAVDDTGHHRVGRVTLAGLLMAALQDKLLKVAPSGLGEAFVRGLQAFTFRPGGAADDPLAAGMATAEEGLVLAAALCTWRAARHVPAQGTPSGRHGRQRYAEVAESILY